MISVRNPFLLILLSGLVALTACAPPRSLEVENLGRIDFPNSGSSEAQEAFVRAVLLLHSFEYDDAREAFQQAQSIDPDFALAFWGEAMTHNHPLWRQRDRAAALETLSRYGATTDERLSRAPTARERDYLQAVEILYEEGDKVDRDKAYAEAMHTLSERYPEDLEARSFYALSILGTAQGVRDFSVYMRAAAVAEEVFAVNPQHPGAAHYLIHSYDDPIHAPLGLRAARVYSRIAPAAAHAQHMISHIFVALGRWEESVGANVKSFEVSVRRRERKGLGVDAQNYHALHWLEYSNLQLGRFDDAKANLDLMTESANSSNSERALSYQAAMRAAWIVNTRARHAPPGRLASLTRLGSIAQDLFATGYASLLNDERDLADRALADLESRLRVAEDTDSNSGKNPYADTAETTLIGAEVMSKSLRALLELDAGRTASALRLLDQATDSESALPLEFGPPDIVKPSHELYGEVLLKLGKPEAAREMFETSLKRAPRRSLSMVGLLEAAAAEGDAVLVAATCADLEGLHVSADANLSTPAICSGT